MCSPSFGCGEKEDRKCQEIGAGDLFHIVGSLNDCPYLLDCCWGQRVSGVIKCKAAIQATIGPWRLHCVHTSQLAPVQSEVRLEWGMLCRDWVSVRIVLFVTCASEAVCTQSGNLPSFLHAVGINSSTSSSCPGA